MTKGIHHITAIASNARDNVNFYTKVLGLRLVKKTVNQDDTGTYHLFFGDRHGHPGMDLTFFIFLPAAQGIRGNGLVTMISLEIPKGSLKFWQQRFKEHSVKHEEVLNRFGHARLVFFDDDNQQLELVEVEGSKEENDVWTTDEVSKEHAIRNFHSATLSVISHASIEPILKHVFGYTYVSTEEKTHLFKTAGSMRANLLEVKEEPSAEQGFNAAGTVHHIAFRADDEKQQLEMRDKVLQLGLHPTEVINRFYFKSVYFRTPAGILFEIATDGPGFTADEKEEELGKNLSLPPFLEDQRTQIEANLTPISTE